jgi:tRNA(adenine34) deaminase
MLNQISVTIKFLTICYVKNLSGSVYLKDKFQLSFTNIGFAIHLAKMILHSFIKKKNIGKSLFKFEHLLIFNCMIENIFSDEYFMKEALKEAQKAFDKDEVPIGAVIVHKNRIIARSHNLTETLNDVTAHAEMQAFTSAANTIGGKYLVDCALYVTVEPCPMCAGAAYWSQISKIVYGAADMKRGYTTIKTPLLHPKTEVLGGVFENECANLMKLFFKKKRN